MIRVQEKQLGAIGQALALDKLEDDMVVHLHGFSPTHAELIGDEWLRRAVRLGIERAAAYGVANPGLLRFYVEMMLLFGSMFDTDPLLPWAGDILRDPAIPSEEARMGRLHDALLAYLDAVDGSDRGASLAALRELGQVLREDIPAAELLVEENAIRTLTRIHPRYCAYAGEPLLRQLLRLGHEAAARLDVATDRGVVLVTGLIFALGHGFAEDPLFPWARATLRDPSLASPAARASRLETRAKTYLERALDHYERRRADASS